MDEEDERGENEEKERERERERRDEDASRIRRGCPRRSLVHLATASGNT